MKLKSLSIRFELEEGDDPDTTTECDFEGGQWKINGKLYSRYFQMLHNVWQIIRTELKSNK